MMSTTTIRLPSDLKARVAAAAKKTGKSTHSFILEAIAEKAQDTERATEFHALADERFAAITASGKTIPWAEMRSYLEARLVDKKPRRPVARKLAR
jgi:predicted transcriptional regulator